jgi:hypothetical protein
MDHNYHSLFLYQTIVALWTLTFVSIGFVITWTLIQFQEPKDRKRPGINIKEL